MSKKNEDIKFPIFDSINLRYLTEKEIKENHISISPMTGEAVQHGEVQSRYYIKPKESDKINECMDKRDWLEFRDSGLLWLINTTLHVFGWAIALDINSKHKAIYAYPYKTKYRGFGERTNNKGHAKITTYMKENAENLYKDLQEEGLIKK
jgi:hypothetical protein